MPNIVKNTTFPNLLDLIAPHSCRGCGRLGSPLCDNCKNYISANNINLCPVCKTTTPTGKCKKCRTLPSVFIVGKRDGLLDILIHDYKYNSVRAIGPKLAKLLDAKLPSDINQAIIIPLPTATHHIRARGLDHTHLIAKHLAKLRNYKVQNLLLRNKNTVQVGADRKSRLAQANEAFIINPKIKIDQNATYILLDDVWTTGASIRAAIKKLRQAGAKNIIVALLAVSSLD